MLLWSDTGGGTFRGVDAHVGSIPAENDCCNLVSL
jgi:hypothetical protein